MKKNLILSVLTGLLCWLAWPPIPYTSPLLLVAFVPLLLAFERVMRGGESRKGRKVFLLALLAGGIWNTASIYWVFNALKAVMPVYAAAFVSLIPFGLAAVLMALCCWLYYRMRRYYPPSLSLLSLASFWIAYEYLHQSWELAFPWMTLGNGFANAHQLVQWYEYTGVYGGSAWIWLVNSLVFLLVASTRYKWPVWQAGKKRLAWIIGCLVVLPAGWSVYRYAAYDEPVNPSNVVVVQPNIDPYGKFGSIPAGEQLERLIRLSDSVGETNTEFFIWPETAIARQGGFDEDHFGEHPFYYRIRDFLSSYRNGNLLSGIETYRVYDEPSTPTARQYKGLYYDSFNASVLIENSSRLQFYHKSKLVPGVEQTPYGNALAFMEPLFKAFGGATGGYGSQPEPSVFYAQSGIGAAPVICYESIWGDYVGKYIKQGAQFIAVVTNDGWWGNTSGKDQHLAYAKLRAIETRRWVARAANTGISAFINEQGDIVKKSGWWEQAVLKADISLNNKLTFYVKHGDYLAKIGVCISALSLLSLLYAIVSKRLKRKKS